MDKKLLLQEEHKAQKVKEIAILKDPQKLRMILGSLSWKILVALSEKEMYPLELARKLGIHEQKVYYHIRKLVKAGAITVVKEEEKKGGKYEIFAKLRREVVLEISLSNAYSAVEELLKQIEVMLKNNSKI
jgi:predicted transcriptional regulator